MMISHLNRSNKLDIMWYINGALLLDRCCLLWCFYKIIGFLVSCKYLLFFLLFIMLLYLYFTFISCSFVIYYNS